MRSLELFAGAGGLGLGFSNAGFIPVSIIERDRPSCRTLSINKERAAAAMSGWGPIIGEDVRFLDYREFPAVDLVTGGPPCQPFSIGGKHGAHSDSRDMFPEAVRAVRELRPRGFVFENVRGLTRKNFANYFEYIKLQMMYPTFVRSGDESWEDHHGKLERHHLASRRSGVEYRVLTRLLNAADYGVPQQRFRVFFVGFRSDLTADWAFPEATHSLESLEASKMTGEYFERHGIERTASSAGKRSSLPLLKPWVTVRDALSDLPDPEVSRSPGLTNHDLQRGAKAYPGHTGSPLDEPSKALKAGDHGVPGGENMLVKDDGGVRYYTVREAARIQTFPDEYFFPNAWSENMRQLGNAVPVRLAQVVATSVRRTLEPHA